MNSVQFNGKDLPKFVKLVGREISVLPDLDVKYHELPRQIGGSFLYTKQGVKKESLDFTLIPEKLSNVDAAATEFAQWLRGNDFKPSKIIFADKPDRYSMAQVNGSVSVSDLFLYGSVSVEFLYVDPLSYLNSDLSVSGETGLKVTYSGIVEQPFIADFTVLTACKAVVLRSTRTSKRIRLLGNFPDGTVIQIDNDKKQIKVNGQLNMKVLTLDSQWLELVTGSNTIHVDLDGTQKLQTPMSIKSKVAVY